MNMEVISVHREQSVVCIMLLIYLLSTAHVCFTYPVSDVDAAVSNQNCPSVCVCDQSQSSIDCSHRSLMRPLPFQHPAEVKALYLCGNRISHINAGHFANLTSLEFLDLSKNMIGFLPDDVFSSTTQLSSLHLSENEFEHIPTAALAFLPSLRHLYLRKNRISYLSATDLWNLDGLLTLDLSANEITSLPMNILNNLPNLLDFSVAENKLHIGPLNELTSRLHPLKTLDLSYNYMSVLLTGDEVQFFQLKLLNISNNELTAIDASWFLNFPQLSTLLLDGNPIPAIDNASFVVPNSLRHLSLRYMPVLTVLGDGSLHGLQLLEELNLTGSENLYRIHSNAFSELRNLQKLDLSNCRLQTVSAKLFSDLRNIVSVRLGGNPWLCDCRLKFVRDALALAGEGIGADGICAAPQSQVGIPLFSVSYDEDMCNALLNEQNLEQLSSVSISNVRLGESVVLQCDLALVPSAVLSWNFGKGKNILAQLNRTVSQDGQGSLGLTSGMFEVHHSFSVIASNLDESESERITLMNNGNLMMNYTTRLDTGYYHCTVIGLHGNETSVVELRLDYTIMSSVMYTSCIIGFLSAFGFFLTAVILGVIRYLAFVCSEEERAKRRSLRELIGQIRNSSQFDRLSAYRTAKLDQFAAFKSATMDQLSAFKVDRVDRLRKYKQATVSAVLHQLERMREHYAAQTARIKESYALNVERLHENYALQRVRFQDRHSVRVQHIRTQYRAQVARARDFSAVQVARLREQYKQQQQYFLKLLELIDVGSCVSQAVEVECMRAESAIFDAGAITFDEEARPSHASRGDETMRYDTTSLPDTSLCRVILTPSLSEEDVDVDDESSTFLTTVDVHVRSFSMSNLGPSTKVMPAGASAGTLLTGDLDGDEAANATVHGGVWKRSESTPVVCVTGVASSNDAANIIEDVTVV